MNLPVSAPSAARAPAGRISPAALVIGVLICLLGISVLVRWTAREVSLPRYCANQRQTLERLERILVAPRPIPEGQARAPYLVAAKLMFLLPRASDEPLAAYLSRVEARIRSRCAGAEF